MADRDIEIKVRITEEGFRQLGVAGKDFDIIRANAVAATSAVTGLGQSLLAGVAGGAVVAGIGAVESALATLPRFLTESVKAAAEAERANNLLINSLRTTGQASAGYIAALNEQATALSRVSTFTDEQVAGIQRQLVTFGASRAEIERLTPVVLDLAVATDRDLGSALLAVTKYSQGNVDAFTRLGLRFEENATQAEKLAKTQEFLARTQGAAAIEAASLHGESANLAKEWGELQEVTGKWLVDLTGLPTALRATKEAIQGLIDGPSEFDAEVQRLIDKKYLGSNTLADLANDRGRIENEAANNIAARRAAAADSAAADEQSLLLRRAQGGDPAALAQLDVLAVNAPLLRDRPEYQGLNRSSTFNPAEQAARDFDRDIENQRLRAEEAKKADAENARASADAARAQAEADRDRLAAARELQDIEIARGKAAVDAASRETDAAEDALGLAEKRRQQFAALAKEQKAAGTEDLAITNQLQEAQTTELRLAQEVKLLREQELATRIEALKVEIAIAQASQQVAQSINLASQQVGVINQQNAASGGGSFQFDPGNFNSTITPRPTGSNTDYIPGIGFTSPAATTGLYGFNFGSGGAQFDLGGFGDGLTATPSASNTEYLPGLGFVTPAAADQISQYNFSSGYNPVANALANYGPGSAAAVAAAAAAAAAGSSSGNLIAGALAGGSGGGGVVTRTRDGERPSDRTKPYARITELGLPGAKELSYRPRHGVGDPNRPKDYAIYSDILSLSPEQLEESKYADHVVAERVAREAQANPGIERLRKTIGPTVGRLEFPPTTDQKERSTQDYVNQLFNNQLLVGASEQETLDLVRQLVGGDLFTSLGDANAKTTTADGAGLEKYRTDVLGLVEIFEGQFPAGINIAAEAVRSLGDDGEVHIGRLQTAIEKAQQTLSDRTQWTLGLDATRNDLNQTIFDVRYSTLTERQQRELLDTRTDAAFNVLRTIDRQGDKGDLTDTERGLAGQAFQQAQESILSALDLATEGLTPGSSAYRRKAQPFLGQLGELEDFTTFFQDDTDRLIAANKAENDRLIAAFKEGQAQVFKDVLGNTFSADGKVIELKLDINGAIHSYNISPQGVADIQNATVQ